MEPLSISQTPPGSGLRRSAASACVCIVETVLSTIVFFYAMIGTKEIQPPQYLMIGAEGAETPYFSLCVALCTGCGIWIGVYHSSFASRVQEAVGRAGWATPPGLDGVNPFEYHDVVTIGLNVTAVISLSLLCVLFGFGVEVLFVFTMLLVPFNLFSGPSPTFWCVFYVEFVLWVWCYIWSMYKCGVVGMFRNLREACLTRSPHASARRLLLVSSALYALVLCVPPIPSLWRWGLITTHIARAIKVYASLEGQTGVVQAHGDILGGDML